MLYVLILLMFSFQQNMKEKETYPLDFYTSHQQFYLVDSSYLPTDDGNEAWTDSAFHQRLIPEKGRLSVITECYGPVKGVLEICDRDFAEDDFSAYDHVVEGKIALSTGVLQVQDCPTSQVETEVKLKPGLYHVRVYSRDLSTVFGDEGDDFYRIVVWPVTEDTDMTVRVLKQYHPAYEEDFDIQQQDYPLNFNTSHRQFYLGDSSYFAEDINKEFCSESNSYQRSVLAESFQAIAIRTETESVKGILEIRDKDFTEDDFSTYDHVAEGKIVLNTGVLQAPDFPSSQVVAEVNLKPAIYHVRIYSRGLGMVIGNKGNDFYRVIVWLAKDPDMEIKVLKPYLP